MADQFSRLYDVERVGGDQRTRLAELLRSQGMNQPQGQMVSGWYVPPSWSQNLNSAVQMGLGTYMGGKIDEERKAKTAEILRQLSQGKEVEPIPAVQNFNGMERMAEGQTPFPQTAQQPPQNEFERLTRKPQMPVEQSQMNPAMTPRQEQRFVPLTEEEKIGKVMELAQYNPYAAQVWSAQDTARQNRLTKAEERELDFQRRKELQQQQLEGRMDMLRMGAMLRPAPQPQAPVAVMGPNGQPVYVSPSQAYGMTPAGGSMKLSATQEKEVLEADDIVKSSQNAIGNLNSALNLNKIAYSGLGAKARAIARSNVPLAEESKEANATIEMDNLIGSQALESLKTVFGGNPTEGERKILIELQASVDKTPAQRQAIIERARDAAENRLRYNMQKGEALRGGTYMRPGYNPTANQPQAGGMPDMNAIDAEIARRRGR